MKKKYKTSYFIPVLFLIFFIFFIAIYFYNIKNLNQIEKNYELEKNITEEINKNKFNLKLNKNIKNDKEKLHKITLNTPFILENLSRFFSEHDIIIDTIYFRKIKNSEQIDFLPVKLSVSCAFSDFKKMLLDLSSLPFLVLIHDFSIQQDARNRTSMLEIKLKLFIINLSDTTGTKK